MKKMVQQMMIYLHLTMHPQKTTPMQRWKKSTESHLIEKGTNRFQSDNFDLSVCVFIVQIVHSKLNFNL